MDTKRLFACLALAFPLLSALRAPGWDFHIVHHVNGWEGELVRAFNSVVSHSEPFVVVVVPLALALAGWARRNRRLLADALCTGLSVAVTFLVGFVLKLLVDRARPFEAYPDLIHPYSLPDDPSFPSGHTATAFALALALCLRYPRWYVVVPAALWACAVGLSRMNEGVHYPTDVLAGAALGVLLALACHWLLRRRGVR